MTVTPKLAVAFALLYHSRFQRKTRHLNWQTRRFKRKQTRENVCGLCLDQIAYTAISIKVVPKTREKVEYERERLIGKD